MESPSHIHVFLNIEGVVCPQGSGLAIGRETGREELSRLWTWAQPLQELAEAFDLRLVLRSSWTLQLPLEQIALCMSDELRGRLAGFTDPIAEIRFSGARMIATPYEVITRFCEQNGVRYWCALDDRTEGWPGDERWRLICPDPAVGLSAPNTVQSLRAALCWLTLERDFIDKPRD